MSLDTKIKTVDLINSKQTLELSRSGQLPIKYGCNFTNDENNLTYKSSSKIHDDILTFHLLVEFEYQAECGRCLSIDICQNTNSRDFSLNLNTENDYELNLDSEFVDFEPDISIRPNEKDGLRSWTIDLGDNQKIKNNNIPIEQTRKRIFTSANRLIYDWSFCIIKKK